MTGYRATAYRFLSRDEIRYVSFQTTTHNAHIHILCCCNHVTLRAVLRQLVFNLVAIGFLRDTQSGYDDGPNFARMLTQNIQSTEDVDRICMTYGKTGFNVSGGWSWHLYSS